MPEMEISLELKKRIYDAIKKEAATSEDGWLSSIYRRLKSEEHNFNDWQIRRATDMLVSEGKLERRGTGAKSRWRPTEAERETQEAETVPESLQPQEHAAEELTVKVLEQSSGAATDSQLIDLIDREIARYEERIAALQEDRNTIINAGPARLRAAELQD